MYPLQISVEVAELFENCYPRGAAWVRSNLYIRDEIVPLFFSKDQRLWNKYKRLVKYLDAILERQENYGIPKIDPALIMDQSPTLKDFWRFYRHFDDCYSDALDALVLG
jgi:hypothetical protein